MTEEGSLKGKLLDVFDCFDFALEVRIPSNCRIFQMGSNKAFVEPQQAGRVSASIKEPVEKPNKSACLVAAVPNMGSGTAFAVPAGPSTPPLLTAGRQS